MSKERERRDILERANGMAMARRAVVLARAAL
jgi:hypothetical protein